MKMVKSLLLGSAAGLVAMAGAQAADLPVKAKPVQYVKICSLYGAGFYYIPGTDTCIKIGGFIRAEVNGNAGGSFSVISSGSVDGSSTQGKGEFWRTRAGVTFDTRTQTEYGTLRSYFVVATSEDQGQSGGAAGGGGTGVGNNPGGSGLAPYTRLWSNAAFIQFAGFTAGKTASFFDFDTQAYSNQTNFWGSNYAGSGIDVFAYTAQFGNGMSASLSVEQPAARRESITSAPVGISLIGGGLTYGGEGYGNQEVPDIVGNLRLDQTWGSAQLMGAYHQLRAISSTFPSPGLTTTNDSAWAVGGGLKFNLPMLGQGDYAIVQAGYSDGVLSYIGQGINGGLNVTNNDGTVHAVAPALDAVVLADGSLDKTKAWSVTGGFEHHWAPRWKTSLYGAYGQVRYSDAASAVLGGALGSANWNYGQIGSRTVWTPVANLDLSLEVMYNRLDTAFGGATLGAFVPGGPITTGDKEWVSGIFRVQRNFYP
jgi:hypothetical protein